MNHLMIDLETLGTSPGAPVLSIGACYFDPVTGEIGDKFHQRIDAADALRYARMSGDTFKWWLRQSDDARRKVVQNAGSAREAFEGFDAFCRKHGTRNLRPWGNGASFDITILDVSYQRIMDREAPWAFWNVRDVRTIKELGEAAGHHWSEKLEGTAHDALDDAVFQARYVSFYWQGLLGIGGSETATGEASQSDDDIDLLG
jgi:hypothetical protein